MFLWILLLNSVPARGLFITKTQQHLIDNNYKMNNISDSYHVGLLIARCEANATVPGLVALDSNSPCAVRGLFARHFGT
jgi:hypothetical protein